MARRNPKYDVDALDWKTPVLAAAVVTVCAYIIGGIDWELLFNGRGAVLSRISYSPPTKDKLIILALGCLIGSAVAVILQQGWFWFVFSLLWGAVAIVSYIFYSGESFGIWWALPAVAMLFASMSVYMNREIIRLRSLERLRSSLDGIVPPADLEAIIRHPSQLNTEVRQVSASVLVIQIVGIENIRNRFQIDDVLYELTRLNKLIEQTAHKFGGIKMRGYRDDFVVLFGDTLRRNTAQRFHAEMSLQCAAELQMENAMAVSKAAEQKRPVLAIRIGISSGRMTLGNIGSHNILDTIIMGDQLDQAKRYEQSCDINSVLFGRMTRDLLVKIDPNSDVFTRKLLNLDRTGGSNVQEVYEFDPFRTNPELRRNIMNALRQAAKFERKEERHPARNNDTLFIETNFGKAKLMNFSRNGMGILMKAPLSNGTTVRIQIKAESATLMNRLANRKLTAFNAEVRWARQTGELNLHGLFFKNVEEPDRDFLLQCLLEYHEASEQSQRQAS